MLWEYWGITQHASTGLQLIAGIGASYPSGTPFLISAYLLYSLLLQTSILFPSLCSSKKKKKKMASANSSRINIVLAQKDSQGDLQIPKDNCNWPNVHQLFTFEPIIVIIRISQRKKAKVVIQQFSELEGVLSRQNNHSTTHVYFDLILITLKNRIICPLSVVSVTSSAEI